MPVEHFKKIMSISHSTRFFAQKLMLLPNNNKLITMASLLSEDLTYVVINIKCTKATISWTFNQNHT